MYALDTASDKWVWRRLFSFEWPPARIHAGFVQVGYRKFFIGGTSYPENLLFNDIWYCTFQNVLWETDSLDLPGLSWKRLNLKLGSTQMPTLKAHCAVSISKNEIFIFGGYSQDGETSNISLIIDIGLFIDFNIYIVINIQNRKNSNSLIPEETNHVQEHFIKWQE